MDYYTITQFVLIALGFTLFQTGAWKKSYSTFIFLISTSISLHLFKMGKINEALVIITIIAIAIAIRAMLHKTPDNFIRHV